MSEPAEIHDRVDSLEDEMARVRYLASHANKDVSDVQAAVRGQTGVINAIRETQLEQGERLAEHGKRLERLEHKVDRGFKEMSDGFAQINQNFAVVEERFGTVKTGMDQITNLLTPDPDRPDED